MELAQANRTVVQEAHHRARAEEKAQTIEAEALDAERALQQEKAAAEARALEAERALLSVMNIKNRKQRDAELAILRRYYGLKEGDSVPVGIRSPSL